MLFQNNLSYLPNIRQTTNFCAEIPTETKSTFLISCGVPIFLSSFSKQKRKKMLLCEKCFDFVVFKTSNGTQLDAESLFILFNYTLKSLIVFRGLIRLSQAIPQLEVIFAVDKLFYYKNVIEDIHNSCWKIFFVCLYPRNYLPETIRHGTLYDDIIRDFLSKNNSDILQKKNGKVVNFYNAS